MTSELPAQVVHDLRAAGAHVAVLLNAVLKMMEERM